MMILPPRRCPRPSRSRRRRRSQNHRRRHPKTEADDGAPYFPRAIVSSRRFYSSKTASRMVAFPAKASSSEDALFFAAFARSLSSLSSSSSSSSSSKFSLLSASRVTTRSLSSPTPTRSSLSPANVNFPQKSSSSLSSSSLTSSSSRVTKLSSPPPFEWCWSKTFPIPSSTAQ